MTLWMMWKQYALIHESRAYSLIYTSHDIVLTRYEKSYPYQRIWGSLKLRLSLSLSLSLSHTHTHKHFINHILYENYTHILDDTDAYEYSCVFYEKSYLTRYKKSQPYNHTHNQSQCHFSTHSIPRKRLRVREETLREGG